MSTKLIRTWRAVAAAGAVGGATLAYGTQRRTVFSDTAPAAQSAAAAVASSSHGMRLGHDANPTRHVVSHRPNETKYSPAEVSEHDGRDGGSFWISYKDGVYDITDFISQHPGGRYIGQAAGGAVQGFWEHWSYHHLSGKVLAELEKHRIGTLVGWKEDARPGELYSEEPYHRRTTGQNVLITQPYNSETKPEAAWKLFTETDDFYVRNHSPVPAIGEEDLADYDISFTRCTSAAASGAGGPTGEEVAAISLPSLLAQYPTYTVTSIMQCAGNRAADNIAANNAGGFIGTPYELIDTGMAGNAQWSGPRMRDVLLGLYPELAAMEVAAEERGGGGDGSQTAKNAYRGMHVEFEGVDGYYTSTPLEVIMDPKNDCLLATQMNGAPLPPDHGYPLRAVLPGRAGCRNAKWVNRITVRMDEGDSPWNVTYYKGGEPGAKYTIQDLPLQSIIHEPSPTGRPLEKMVPGAPLTVRGVAYSGASGSTIASVEVSADGGRTWQAADIMHDELVQDDSTRFYGWVRWEYALRQMPTDFVPGTDQQTGTLKSGELTIMCRATASDGTTQPQVGALNGGYLYNGYHQIVVPLKMH